VGIAEKRLIGNTAHVDFRPTHLYIPLMEYESLMRHVLAGGIHGRI
jgi:hypothetical protein